MTESHNNDNKKQRVEPEAHTSENESGNKDDLSEDLKENVYTLLKEKAKDIRQLKRAVEGISNNISEFKTSLDLINSVKDSVSLLSDDLKGLKDSVKEASEQTITAALDSLDNRLSLVEKGQKLIEG